MGYNKCICAKKNLQSKNYRNILLFPYKVTPHSKHTKRTPRPLPLPSLKALFNDQKTPHNHPQIKHIMCEALKNDFHFQEEIGRGKFGVVHRCFSPLSGDSFACKSIDKSLLLDPIDRDCLDKEPKILHILSGHPHILHLHKIYEDDNYLHIISELCPAGDDLFSRISNGPLVEPEAASILKQLVSAISYCHHLGVAHRDIKPDNVLFDSWGRLKLADFGSAEWYGMNCEGRTMRGIVGTPYYVAPEVLMGRDYTEKVDVWSAGVILYIMLSGVPPFYGESPTETFEAVLRANLRFPLKYFRSVSSEAKDLLRKMICKDVSRRFSADEVLRHPWIINGGESRSSSDLT